MIYMRANMRASARSTHMQASALATMEKGCFQLYGRRLDFETCGRIGGVCGNTNRTYGGG